MNNHSAQTDRRTARTRLVIRESLVSLIQELGFNHITVKHITEHANVNRSTFYAHFQDKFNLLDTSIEEKLTELKNLINLNSYQITVPYESNVDLPDPFFVALFKHLGENERFYKVMFTHMEPSVFADKIHEMIREADYTRITKLQMEQKLLVPLDILLDYTSSSIIGVITNWFANNMIYTPQHMALQLTRLGLLGTYRTMGISGQVEITS